jgi:hypothetical protein
MALSQKQKKIFKESGNWYVDLITRKVLGPCLYLGLVHPWILSGTRISNAYQLFFALHELGHLFSLCSFRQSEDVHPYTSPIVVFEEILAWRYVFTCVRQSHWKEVEECAIAALLTYTRCSHPHFTEEFLRFLLTYNL